MATNDSTTTIDQDMGPLRAAFLAARAEVARLEALECDDMPEVKAAFAAYEADDAAEDGYIEAHARAAEKRERDLDRARETYLEACSALIHSDEPCEYTFRDPESGVTETGLYADDDDAREAARDWARDGAYGDIDSTIWVDVYIARETDGGYESDRGSDEETRITVAIDPDAPDCAEGHEHDWQSPYEVLGGLKDNPGVWGKGGGVVCKTVCAHCGAYKIDDSWAQRPDNGEQGLDSVSYEEADDDSREWVASKRLEAARDAIEAAGYSVSSRSNDDRLYIEVSDDGDDDAERVLEQIQAIAEKHGCDASWSGNGNTDADGETTSDVVVTAA